ncbi:hypothetical protein SLE2022_113540 [Rubroshorea leprosula]
MELLKELFLTAFVAILFSFLIAKLVSRVTSGGSLPESESNSGIDVDEETIMQELQFGQRLEVKTFEGQRKVEFVQEIVSKDEEVVAAPAVAEEIGESVVRSGEFEAKSSQLAEKSESEVKFDDVVDKESFGVEKGIVVDQENASGVANVKAESPKSDEISESAALSRQMEAEACQLQEKSESEVKFDDVIERMVKNVEVGEMKPEKLEPEVKFDDIVEDKVENKEVGGFDEALEKIRKDHEHELESDEISVLESKLERVGDEVKEVKLESHGDDDDWEGIERTELEKVFAVAAKYVEGKGELEGIGNDVQMEMYGLHKVATEGPCREPQPMALKVNARAKWNAWQRLGNMSPEVAMEQYVALLSDRVPGWMKDNSTGENKQEPTKVGLQAAIAHDRSSFPDLQTDSTEESISELESTMTGGQESGCSSFDNQAKE